MCVILLTNTITLGIVEAITSASDDNGGSQTSIGTVSDSECDDGVDLNDATPVTMKGYMESASDEVLDKLMDSTTSGKGKYKSVSHVAYNVIPSIQQK